MRKSRRVQVIADDAPKPITMRRMATPVFAIEWDMLGNGVRPFDQGKAEQILIDLTEGLPLQAACAAAGVSEACLMEWRQEMPTLDEAIAKALSFFQKRMITPLVQAAEGGDVKAATFILERRFRQDWAPPQTLQVLIGRMSDDEVLAYADGRLKELGVRGDGVELPMPGQKLLDKKGFSSNMGEIVDAVIIQPSHDGNVVREGEDGATVLDL